MRLSKQFSIVYYGDQEPLINHYCQNQLMFLQGAIHRCRAFDTVVTRPILYHISAVEWIEMFSH